VGRRGVFYFFKMKITCLLGAYGRVGESQPQNPRETLAAWEAGF